MTATPEIEGFEGPGPTVRDAEVTTAGVDEVVVHFVTDPGVEVTTRLGVDEVVTTGPHHVARFRGLDPGVELPLRVSDRAPEPPYLPASVRTLERPRGRLLATIATVNDVPSARRSAASSAPTPRSARCSWPVPASRRTRAP